MKRAIFSYIFMLFIAAFFLVIPGKVKAQYSYICGSCCPGSVQRCSNIACTLGCNSTPSCALGAVTGLNYVGNNNLTATLTWNAAVNATSYNVLVTRGDGVVIVNQASLAATTYGPFAVERGRTYTWSVTPRHNCALGTAAPGPFIGVPFQGDVSLGNLCSNGACNGRDIIVGLDTNHDQKVSVNMTFSDSNPPSGSRYTDIKRAYFLLDNNLNADISSYRVVYIDNEDGTFTLAEDSPNSGTKDDNLAVSNIARSKDASSQTLTLSFDLDLNGLIRENGFLTNVYINAFDFSGFVTGRALKIGTGDFADPPADPYSGNAAAALDIWNGKDVLVSQTKYYQVTDYNTICTQVGLPSPLSLNSTASYTPNNPGNVWNTNLSTWGTSSYYQPYYMYNNPTENPSLVYEATYAPTDPSYYYSGISTAKFGGDCTSGLGTVKGSYKNGGLRVDDSGVGDRSLQTAIAVLPISDPWSQVVDGSYFANSNVQINISPLTCAGCFFTTRSSSPTNGLLLVNGLVNTTSTAVIGSPNSWYAETKSGTKPFTSFELPSYNEIKDLYKGVGYTELVGNQTTGVGGLANPGTNKTIFIDGNLTIDSSTLLRAALNSYLLLVVNGNITITGAVKNPNLSTSAIQAMLVALDDGTGTGNITILDNEADIADLITIEGSLVSAGTISFQRDLEINNNTGPAVRIIFRPDMLSKMQTDDVAIINLQRMLVSQY